MRYCPTDTSGPHYSLPFWFARFAAIFISTTNLIMLDSMGIQALVYV
jgi:hypothetical protein